MEINHVEDVIGWSITLRNGAVLSLFADSYSESEGFHIFGLLVNATDEEQAFLKVEGRNPNNPSLVVLEVMRIRSEDVASISSELSVVDPPADTRIPTRSEGTEGRVESSDSDIRQRIRELLKESESIRDQLNAARQEYRARFHELNARLLVQTSTWRSLHIRKRKLAVEISAIQRRCNELMEEFVKLETIRTQDQQELMRFLSEVPRSDGANMERLLMRINDFNLNELSEGLSLRWGILDQIQLGVEKAEEFVKRLDRGRSSP